ncbi:MAG: ACT domain-containing protein [Planctomycetota bacterium]
MVSLIVTVVGPDRPGLVDALSDAIKRYEGNWRGSRLSQYAGQFAGIVQADVAEGDADALTRDLVNLQSKGLAVQVTSAKGDAGERGDAGAAYTLELLGQDRPGIVRDLARALASRSINVAQLETGSESAPMSGEQLFRANALLHVPATADVDELHDALEHLAAELDLDLLLEAAREAER